MNELCHLDSGGAEVEGKLDLTTTGWSESLVSEGVSLVSVVWAKIGIGEVVYSMMGASDLERGSLVVLCLFLCEHKIGGAVC